MLVLSGSRMIGPCPASALQDIVLQEQPENVDLLCNEELPSEEELDLAPYQILTTCGTCDSQIKIVVFCDLQTIRQLQQLLLGSLRVVCPLCARRNNRNGRP